jgi:hypothetical protein
VRNVGLAKQNNDDRRNAQGNNSEIYRIIQHNSDRHIHVRKISQGQGKNQQRD